MNILAIGAHFDDIELGCGGALARHVDQGDKVIVFIATSSEFSSQHGCVLRNGDTALEEAKKASQIIGYELIIGNIQTFRLEFAEQVNTQLLKIIETNDIDLIYTHWEQDAHHDHKNLALATLHCARHVKRILMYRSNWYDSTKVFQKNFFIDITQTWERKEKAIRAYKTENERVGDVWIEYFKREAMNNGLQMGVDFAEGFQLVRWLV